MRRFLNLRNLVAAAVLASGLIGASANSATACDTPRCYYRTVVVWEERQEAYVEWITVYDECGKPYQIEVVRYRAVSVPVRHRVKVCY